jgi:hypothetical protein
MPSATMLPRPPRMPRLCCCCCAGGCDGCPPVVVGTFALVPGGGFGAPSGVVSFVWTFHQ